MSKYNYKHLFFAIPHNLTNTLTDTGSSGLVDDS